MTRLQRDMLVDVRPLLRSVRKIFTGPNALANFAEHAAAISASPSFTNAKIRPQRARELLLEEDARAIHNMIHARPSNQGDRIALMVLPAWLSPPTRINKTIIEHSTQVFSSISYSAQSSQADLLEDPARVTLVNNVNGIAGAVPMQRGTPSRMRLQDLSNLVHRKRTRPSFKRFVSNATCKFTGSHWVHTLIVW